MGSGCDGKKLLANAAATEKPLRRLILKEQIENQPKPWPTSLLERGKKNPPSESAVWNSISGY